MPQDQKRFSIFYSWQSDLLDVCNSQFIRQGLRTAGNAAEKKYPKLVIEIQEATRDLPGSPNIPVAILEKIKTSDIFVCDVTTINFKDENSRKVPNPNVVFELGYAVSILGWDRIVLLFNKHFGTFPDDMPFDFDRHRASPFVASEKPSAPEMAELQKLLITALSAVIESNPERPTNEQSPEEKKHSRDVENVKWALSTLHIPTLDQHFIDSPHMLTNKVLFLWDSFDGVLQNSLFHIYDDELREAFGTFHSSFGETACHDECYHETNNGTSYVFSNPGDLPLRGKQQMAWNLIAESAKKMKIALKQILNIVRNRYLEVDIRTTNKEAWREYVASQQGQD